MTTVLLAFEWLVWGLAIFIGLWLAVLIRQSAVHRAPMPMWPSLILALAHVALPIIFLFISFSKFHLVWLLLFVRPLSFLAGVGYIPLVSQLLIWPAYFYTCVLTVGTGLRPSSPRQKSPWAARQGAIPLRYLVRAWFQRFSSGN